MKKIVLGFLAFSFVVVSPHAFASERLLSRNTSAELSHQPKACTFAVSAATSEFIAKNILGEEVHKPNGSDSIREHLSELGMASLLLEGMHVYMFSDANTTKVRIEMQVKNGWKRMEAVCDSKGYTHEMWQGSEPAGSFRHQSRDNWSTEQATDDLGDQQGCERNLLALNSMLLGSMLFNSNSPNTRTQISWNGATIVLDNWLRDGSLNHVSCKAGKQTLTWSPSPKISVAD